MAYPGQIFPDTPEGTYQEHGTLRHVTFLDTSHSDLRHAKSQGISWPRKFLEITHFTQ